MKYFLLFAITLISKTVFSQDIIVPLEPRADRNFSRKIVIENDGKAYQQESQTQSFPITLLIDPNGIVIYRGISETAIKDADIILNQLLLK